MARRRLPRAFQPAVVALTVVVAVLAAAFPALLGMAAAAADDPPAVPGPVVLVGTAGLRWTDVDARQTPRLWELLESGSAGTIAARSIHSYSCPADGWLAVSSGRLAADNPSSESTIPCNSLDEVETGEPIPRWFDYLSRSVEDARDAQPGLLGGALAAGGVRVAAIGPGAAIATALTSGVPFGTTRPAPADPDELTEAVRGATGDSDLVVVDIGALSAQPEAPGRSAQLAALDERVGAVLDALPADATTLVASLADAQTEPHLQAMAAHGPGRYAPYEQSLLDSRSTRQPGLVQATDLTPTLLSLLDVASPDTLVGSPVTALANSSESTAERLKQLRDYDAAAQAVSPYTVVFGAGLVLAHLVTYSVSWAVVRRAEARSRRRTLQVLGWITLLLASVPAATFPANLVPWWRAPAPFLTLIGAVLGGALLVTLVATLGPWRRQRLGPLGVVAGATAVVLTIDVVTGSRLMISSLMGLQPLVAGRFYGLGNVAFALFATGALLGAMAAADRLIGAGRRTAALAAVLMIGVVSVVIDGAPGLGSDFGGPLAMIPAFAVLSFFVAQLRASWRIGVGVAAATIAVVAALAWLDWLRPPDERTHLGRFIEAMANGETWQVVGRKLDQNIGILFSSPLGLLVPVVAVVLATAVIRPDVLRVSGLQHAYDRIPVLRPGLLAMLVLLALGFAVNDSGVAVPAVAFSIAVPLVVSVCARVALLDPPGRHAR